MKKYMHITLTLAVLLLLAACSEITSPVSPSNEQSSDSYIYPPIDDVLANLPAGFQAIGMASESALDFPCGPVSFTRFVNASQGATLNNGRGVKVTIGRNVMPYSANITITSPTSCWAVYDFYPHPYQFNSNVEIRWYLSQFILPPGMEWDDLQAWYVNDAGQFEEVTWEYSANGQFFYIWTNHFSRYIVSCPTHG